MKFVICGGGSGGHVSPAIAIYEALKKKSPSSEFLFVGREGGAENRAYRATGERLATLSVSGISRTSIKKAVKGVFSALRAKSAAKKLIITERPDVIIGTGGYVAWPMLSVGASLKIPTVIHESNALPGLTTRIVSKYADLVLLNYAEAGEGLSRRDNLRVVGNPLRKEFVKTDRRLARKRMGIRDDEIMILSFGGSLGAQKINETVIDLMRCYSSRKDNIKHLHATGAAGFETVGKKVLADLNGKNGCKVLPYIDNMATAMSAADIVISRCGAMTLSEICAVGVASILIPSPNVADNHQLKNAQYLENLGAAITIEESDLTPRALMDRVRALVEDVERRRSLATAAGSLGKTDAASLISNEILSIAK